jgi:hypothetical protein
MFLRGSKTGRSAGAMHKVVGVVTFALSGVLLVVCWFSNR